MDFLLGIDIGTSKVAAVLVGGEEGNVVAVRGSLHGGTLAGMARNRAEQDAGMLLDAARSVIAGFGPERLGRVRAVGVTGQMHGAVLLDAHNEAATHLVTWQDQRCLEQGFVGELAERTGEHGLRTGFGNATLAWLLAHGMVPGNARGLATIHDLLVARLCGLDRVVTDPTDAAGMGFYDILGGCWRDDALRAAGIDPGWQPEVRPCGARAGSVCVTAAAAFGLTAGAPVMVAVGDNQASVWASVRDGRPEETLAVTLGTGGQLSAVMESGFVPTEARGESYEYRPFPDSRFGAVAASLCGGSAFAWIVDTVRTWLDELGIDAPPRELLFETLSSLGTGASGCGLDVSPRFAGERHVPDTRGQIRGIDRNNFSLGNLVRALARGIAHNLRDMLPAECLAGRRRVVGSGNAVRRLPVVQECLAEVFRLPLELPDSREEAATGAALLARGLV